MVSEEMINLILVNLPNFVGLVICVFIEFRIIVMLHNENIELREQCFKARIDDSN